jgi:hypothetical protein
MSAMRRSGLLRCIIERMSCRGATSMEFVMTEIATTDGSAVRRSDAFFFGIERGATRFLFGAAAIARRFSARRRIMDELDRLDERERSDLAFRERP